MFKRIDHTEIIPAQFEKTFDFYTRILGFKVKERKPGRPGTPWNEIVYLTLGDTMIEMLNAKNPLMVIPQLDQVGYRMIAIEVDDMDAAVKFLKGQGVEISREPMVMGKLIRAEIKDPNSLSLELRQWLPE